MTDNRDILNDAEVDFLLQGTEDDAASGSSGLDADRQDVTMRGDLEKIRLADIFQTFSMSKMQGVLRVRNPLEERQVFCSDGYVRVLAPARVALRRLGQRLIRARLLQPEQLRSALVQQRKERVPLGELLVREGLVARTDLDEVLELQAAEDLFALFTWQHGTFEFFRSERADALTPPAFQGCPEYEINSLLLEVARRADEWQRILDGIQSLDDVPQRGSAPSDAGLGDEIHQALLAGVDGRQTYRQIADQTTYGLFECARAARELVAAGCIEPLAPNELVGLARTFAEDGEPQRAVVMLQTLDDRGIDLEPAVVGEVASVLEHVGERRLASARLLQAAQKSASASEALQLSREAARLAPHDAAALHFLRSVLLAHDTADGRELHQVTLDLLDALIDADLLPRAMQILAECLADDEADIGLLVRRARAQQKANDEEGAVDTLVQLAEAHASAGARDKAVDSYLAALRLDGSRKDIARTVAAMRRTRAGNVVRWAAAGLAALMVGAAGLVWLEQRHLDAATAKAMAQVQELLDAEDRGGARAALESWREQLGDAEAITDLTSRVEFAEAAETKRRARARRAQLTQRMSDAADALARGAVQEAMRIYREVHAEDEMDREVEEIAHQRLRAVMDELTRSTKTLLHELPPDPGALLGRAEVARNLARCVQIVPPRLLRAYDEFMAIFANHADQVLLRADAFAELRAQAAQLAGGVATIRGLVAGYEAAIAQSDAERRLDPMFKAAVAREEGRDFVGALALYRELAEQHTGAAELREHFRARVTRNATITRLMAALAAATGQGDFFGAHQQLRALRKMFPEVPFDELVRLPLDVRTEPQIAEVFVTGEPARVSPVVLERTPALAFEVTVRAEGFTSLSKVFTGDDPASWTARLALKPSGVRQHESAVEVAPTTLPGGDVLVVDRGGCVTRLDATLREVRWQFRSDDLSGFLSRATPFGELALVASLDGTLRALDLATGRIAWRLEDLATELDPVRMGDRLYVATTDACLHAIDLQTRERSRVEVQGERLTDLLAAKTDLLTVSVTGDVKRWSTSLAPMWSRDLRDHEDARGAVFGDVVVISDDQGHVSGVDLESGELRWRRDLGEAPLGPAARGLAGVLLTTPGQLVAVRARDGDVQVVSEGAEPTWSGPAVRLGDRLVCARRDGVVQVLNARSGQPLYLLPGDSHSRVLQTSEQLFVVDEDHEVRWHRALR